MSKGIENLKIYKMAERLEIFVFRFTEKFPKDEKYRSVSQLRRSSSSVTDNISESHHRFHYLDKINRLYIARGEAGETRDGVVKANKKGFISAEVSEFTYEKTQNL